MSKMYGIYNLKAKASPLSNPQDGLLNLTCVIPKEKVTKTRGLLEIRSGKHIYDERNKFYWVDEVSVSSTNKPIKVMIDGENKEFDELKLKIVPNIINIYYHD